MKALYESLMARLSFLEKGKQTAKILIRINELSMSIALVEKLLLEETKININQ